MDELNEYIEIIFREDQLKPVFWELAVFLLRFKLVEYYRDRERLLGSEKEYNLNPRRMNRRH